jgi:hypothetical protein
MENTKKQQTKQYFATLWRGLHRGKKNLRKPHPKKNKQNPKNPKLYTSCLNSCDMVSHGVSGSGKSSLAFGTIYSEGFLPLQILTTEYSILSLFILMNTTFCKVVFF